MVFVYSLGFKRKQMQKKYGKKNLENLQHNAKTYK